MQAVQVSRIERRLHDEAGGNRQDGHHPDHAQCATTGTHASALLTEPQMSGSCSDHPERQRKSEVVGHDQADRRRHAHQRDQSGNDPEDDGSWWGEVAAGSDEEHAIDQIRLLRDLAAKVEAQVGEE